jgi:uncharacterized lipoprotein YajG
MPNQFLNDDDNLEYVKELISIIKKDSRSSKNLTHYIAYNLMNIEKKSLVVLLQEVVQKATSLQGHCKEIQELIN